MVSKVDEGHVRAWLQAEYRGPFLIVVKSAVDPAPGQNRAGFKKKKRTVHRSDFVHSLE